MENQDYFSQIIDFADGTLDPSKEDNLFIQLTNNDELRTEFKSHLAIKSAISSVATPVSVPVESKKRIFVTLGLSLPGSIGFFTKYRLVFAASLFSIMLTTSVLYFLFIDNSNNKSKINASEIINKQNNVPNVSSKEIQFNNHNKSFNKVKRIKKFDRNDNNLVTDLNSYQPKNHQNNFIINKTQHELKNNSLIVDNKGHNDNLINLDYNYHPMTDNIIMPKNNLFLEFRGSNYWMNPKPSIAPKNSALFNNMAVSGIINMNEDFLIGLDLRQENFYLKYRGYEGNFEYFYEQQPNLTTLSGILRYKYDLTEDCSPFVQVSLGANTAGLVSRGMFGINYSILENSGFVFGFEFSNLTYKHNSNLFNNYKFGLNYGFIYKF